MGSRLQLDFSGNLNEHLRQNVTHFQITVNDAPSVFSSNANQLVFDFAHILYVGNCTNFRQIIKDNIHDSIRQAVDYLQGLGRHDLVFYGCNPHATSDPWREKVFRTLVGENAAVFYNNDSLEHTFEDFWGDHQNYDGVICANDYAALSLVRHLQDRNVKLPDELFIVGCGDLFLSRINKPSITSISDDYEHFGRAALSIYNLVTKENTISTVTIQLHSQLHPRMTTGCIPYQPGTAAFFESTTTNNPFFSDTEIAEMVRLETLLNQCDMTDMEVIRCLLKNKTYSQIAETCYISETAVKYRVRKMEEVCCVKSREALTSFLRNFFTAHF